IHARRHASAGRRDRQHVRRAAIHELHLHLRLRRVALIRQHEDAHPRAPPGNQRHIVRRIILRGLRHIQPVNRQVESVGPIHREGAARRGGSPRGGHGNRPGRRRRGYRGGNVTAVHHGKRRGSPVELHARRSRESAAREGHARSGRSARRQETRNLRRGNRDRETPRGNGGSLGSHNRNFPGSRPLRNCGGDLRRAYGLERHRRGPVERNGSRSGQVRSIDGYAGSGGAARRCETGNDRRSVRGGTGGGSATGSSTPATPKDYRRAEKACGSLRAAAYSGKGNSRSRISRGSQTAASLFCAAVIFWGCGGGASGSGSAASPAPNTAPSISSFTPTSGTAG